MRYSGSLLKYSFSEAAHRKVVQIVDMDESGACTIEDVRLAPRRDLREVGGLLADLLRGPGPGESAEDYLLIHLLDTGAIFDAMSRLRAVYPHVLHIDRPALDPDGTGDGHRIDPQKMTEAELFRTFFADVTGEALPSEGERAFGETLEEMRRDEREVKP